MAKSELIVGLDIGTTKICTVVGEAGTDGGVDIIGIGTSPSTGLRKGVVVNIEQTVQSIKKALEEAELMAGCEIRAVYAGIAGSHIKGFNSHGVIAVKGGEVTARDIERVIDAAKAVAIPLDREVIHILPQEYIVDDQSGIADPLGMAGVRLEVKVHIVTGAVTSAQNIVKSCHKSGLDVEDIVLEAFASSKSVLTDEEREIGVALVDIGGGTSDIAIFHGNSIKHTGVIALGGTNLTNDIAFGLRTPTQAAEKIKIKYGCALAELVKKDEIIEVPSVGGREPRKLTRQVLAEICEPRMEELLALVDQELIRSGYKKLIGAGVVLTGGAARIEGIQELAEQVFNLPTRTGSPTGVGGLRDVVDSPMYATAVGLLLYGAEKHGRDSKIRIRDKNIFQSILARMKKWFVDIS
jgi:cell division protein FtsA